jgi:hypothetical protein
MGHPMLHGRQILGKTPLYGQWILHTDFIQICTIIVVDFNLPNKKSTKCCFSKARNAEIFPGLYFGLVQRDPRN